MGLLYHRNWQTGFLIPLGCYNKITQARWLIQNLNLFLTVLEADISDQVPVWSSVSLLPEEDFFFFFSLYPHMVEGDKELSGISNPIQEDLITSHRLLLTPSNWAFKFQYMNLGAWWTQAFRPCMSAESLQSCPTLCNTMDCNPPVPSVHGILQARILESIAISFSRGPSQPRDQTCISCVFCLESRFFTHWATVVFYFSESHWNSLTAHHLITYTF